MKTIDTHLTEKSFLDRLSRFCLPYDRGNKGYVNQEAFVYSRKDQKFWIGHHMVTAGRDDGFAKERINAAYRVNDNGYVTVTYSFGKHPTIMTFHAIAFLLGLIPAVGLLTDAMRQSSMAVYGGICGLSFMGYGLWGFFGRPKELAIQEEHLQYICDALKQEEGEEITEPDTLDVSDIADKDVYPVLIEYQGKSYLTIHYYTADGNSDSILNDGENIVYFKDEAQVNRFCVSHELMVAANGTPYHFDDPVTDARDHSSIMSRWNLLNTISTVLNIPFEGNSHDHDELYEQLFAMSLPAEDSMPMTDFNETQMAELETVFAEQGTLLSRFRPYRE